MKKSFSEIADALTECGIKGITDELIRSLETRFASDGYQECIVFYGDEQWADKFSERTGVELARSLS